MNRPSRHGLVILTAAALFACTERSPELAPPSSAVPSALHDLAADSNLNGDWQTRDRILGIAVRWGEDDSGGIFSIDRIELSTLEQLLADNFVDPSDQQNEAPTVAQIVAFLRSHPGTYAFGYAVSPARSDYRVSLEGIAVPHATVTPELRSAVETFCQDADETGDEPYVYCWWD